MDDAVAACRAAAWPVCRGRRYGREGVGHEDLVVGLKHERAAGRQSPQRFASLLGRHAERGGDCGEPRRRPLTDRLAVDARANAKVELARLTSKGERQREHEASLALLCEPDRGLSGR